MAMMVQHNMAAMNANRMLGITTGAQSKSTEKLSSGYKINRAADDAAGLAISEKMRGQIRGLNKASSNSQDGISLIQTAEGALSESQSIIQRMRELSVQAANDTNTDDDRTQIQNEIDQLTQEVDRIANSTEFNTKKLLNGERTGAVNEKAGKTNIDSSFGNSTVTAAVTTDGSAKAAFTDVIRVEITKDFTVGQSTKNTPKLTEDEIGKIGALLTTNGNVTLEEVPGATSGTVITNTGSRNTQSTEENIAAAISDVKNALTSAIGNKQNSAKGVAANDATLYSVVNSIYNAATTDGQLPANEIALADGVTQDDIKDAVNNYVNALTEAGSQTSNKADGKSNAIAEAENNIKSLFSSSATSLAGDTTAVQLAKTMQANGTTQNGQVTVAAVSGGTVGDFGTKLAEGLIKVAIEIAATKISDNQNQAKVDQLEEFKKTLGDTDLCKAIVNYKNAQTELNGATSPDEAKKAELQSKVDQAKAELDKLNTAGNVLTVSDLFGNTDDLNKFSIGSKVDDDNKLTITMQSKSGDDTVITINNADKLKAGDVITITSEAMVESKQAATGKDALRLQIGANAGQEVALGINSMRAEDLNIVQTKEGSEGKALDVTTQAGASMAVNAYDMALQKVSTERAKMGAMQNRLEHTISNLDTASENTQSAESRIRDTDMATEMVNFSKNNILAQAGQSMLAQANQSTQGVLSLLG